MKEEFPAPNSNQSASLGSVNVKNATRVGRTDRGFPLDGEQQRKVFAADGLTWIFYSDGKNLIYQTSGNGSSWSDPINVTAQPKGFHFSIWYDPASNSVFYVNVDGYSCGFCRCASSMTAICWRTCCGVISSGAPSVSVR